MASGLSDAHPYLADEVRHVAKLVILGPFGVGKTTFVSAVSEIEPLRTEERMTQAGETIDHLGHTTDKTTTTVAMDFGRLTIGGDTALYLFGAPGQERFQKFTTRLLSGALGALVLVDTRRLEDSFEPMGRLEEAGIPYAVAINQFPDSKNYPLQDVRKALDLDPETPLRTCDARYRDSAKEPLIDLITYLITRAPMETAP